MIRGTDEALPSLSSTLVLSGGIIKASDLVP